MRYRVVLLVMSGGLFGLRVDAGERDFTPGQLHDFVCLVWARTACAPAPGLDRGFRNAEQIGASLVPVGLDEFRKCGHAYIL